MAGVAGEGQVPLRTRPRPKIVVVGSTLLLLVVVPLLLLCTLPFLLPPSFRQLPLDTGSRPAAIVLSTALLLPVIFLCASPLLHCGILFLLRPANLRPDLLPGLRSGIALRVRFGLGVRCYC